MKQWFNTHFVSINTKNLNKMNNIEHLQYNVTQSLKYHLNNSNKLHKHSIPFFYLVNNNKFYLNLN